MWSTLADVGVLVALLSPCMLLCWLLLRGARHRGEVRQFRRKSVRRGRRALPAGHVAQVRSLPSRRRR